MNESPRRTLLGLRAIAVFEAVKGALAFAAGCGLLSLRHTDLHAATDAFLLRRGIDPETPHRRLFIESVASTTHHHAGQIAAFAFLYTLVRSLEAYGLWRAKHWAEWFAVVSAGLFLPLELDHSLRRPSPVNLAVITVNLAIIAFLARLLLRQRRMKLDEAVPRP
jgi:uncharacterized membrane protein (DUF2068 family)